MQNIEPKNKRRLKDEVLIMISNNVSYIRAYTEINCLLEYLPQTYINKIPKKLIKLIKNQANKQYNISIDTNKSLLEQNFSKRTKDLIAVIKYNYWSTAEEKQQLKQIFYDNEDKYRKESLEKYDPNNIFKNREEKIEVSQPEKKNNIQMVVYKENIFIKFFNKIKKFFRKK